MIGVRYVEGHHFVVSCCTNLGSSWRLEPLRFSRLVSVAFFHLGFWVFGDDEILVELFEIRKSKGYATSPLLYINLLWRGMTLLHY